MKKHIILFFINTCLCIGLKAQVSFATAANYGVGTSPRSVCSADVNGDGHADLAVAKSGGIVSVLLGSVTGTFAPAVDYAVGTNPFAVCSADVNSDGHADLAVANDWSHDVSVLLGSATGTFAPAVNYPVGSSPLSICSADVNGDGHTDLVAANRSSNTMSVLLGSATGTFAPAVNYPVGSGPFSICSVDVNGDGHTDLAITSAYTSTVSVLLGSVTGTFAPAVDYGVGASPTSVCSADVNGDGYADLATANNNSNNVSVLLGSATGTFAPAVHYVAGIKPRSICVEDFNGDGKKDLAVANFDSHNVSVLLGSGTGTFASALNFPVGSYPYSVCSADINGDGKPDLVVANSSSNDVSVLLNTTTFLAGEALGFDGINDYVDAGTGINLSNSSFTIEFWAKPSVMSSFRHIIGQGTPNTNQCLVIGYGTGDEFTFAFWGNDLNSTYTYSGDLNQWHHWALVYDNSLTGLNRFIYRDGVLENAGHATANYQGTGSFYIGNNSFSSGQNFAGLLDEVRVWNVARTECDINTHKNYEIAGTVPGLMANYHFNQGVAGGSNTAVTNLTDASASVNTGTLSGFTLTGAGSNWVSPGAVATGSNASVYTASITSSTNVSCYGNANGAATVTATGIGGYTYSWTPSGGTGATASGLAAGNYTCTVSNICGTITKNITITQPAAIVKSQTVTLCAGQSVTVGASTYTATGLYTNILPAQNGCDSTITTNLTVNTPTITVNSGAICTGNSFTMTPGGVATYTFSNGTAIVSPTTTTSYTVSGNTSGCAGTNTAVATVTVNALPSVSLTTASTSVCINSGSITLTGTPNGGTYSGTNVSGTTFNPITSGTFTPAYSFTNTTTGCSKTASTSIVVSLCTGIEAITGTNDIFINVYPNPTSGTVTIELNAPAKITVMNVVGQKILEEEMGEGKHTVDLSKEVAGIYFIKVTQNNTQQVLKLIKQ